MYLTFHFAWTCLLLRATRLKLPRTMNISCVQDDEETSSTSGSDYGTPPAPEFQGFPGVRPSSPRYPLIIFLTLIF